MYHQIPSSRLPLPSFAISTPFSAAAASLSLTANLLIFHPASFLAELPFSVLVLQNGDCNDYAEEYLRLLDKQNHLPDLQMSL